MLYFYNYMVSYLLSYLIISYMISLPGKRAIVHSICAECIASRWSIAAKVGPRHSEVCLQVLQHGCILKLGEYTVLDFLRHSLDNLRRGCGRWQAQACKLFPEPGLQ